MTDSCRRSIHIVHRDAHARGALHAQLVSFGYAVRSFADAVAFGALGMPEQPDCVLVDADLPDDIGLSLQRAVQGTDVNIPVVFVADDPGVATAVRAMKLGAIDFLPMPVAARDLAEAVACAVDAADAWRAEAARRTRARALVARLTPREHAVFLLLLEGKLNKQIASELESQEATVKVHRSRLIRKLEVRSLAELLDLGRHLDQSALASEAPRLRRRATIRDVVRVGAPAGDAVIADAWGRDHAPRIRAA